jgi:hypothetical protein
MASGRRARSRRSRRLVEGEDAEVPRDGERAACEVTEIGRPGEEIGSVGSGRPGEIAACVGSVAAEPRARGEADPREWRKKKHTKF